MKRPAVSVVSESLQATSRVLSARGQHELAGLQECAIQLLGYVMLAGCDAVVVQERSSADTTRHMKEAGLTSVRAAEVLALEESALWVGSESSHMVVIQALNNEEEWEFLPVQLRNYVSRAQMPCHLVLAIEQLTLEGDTCHRHATQPVFVVLSRDAQEGLVPAIALATEEYRSALHRLGKEVTMAEAQALLEPYMRILYAGITHVAGVAAEEAS